MRQRKTKRGVVRIAYSPSGNLLVGRDAHNDLHVWDARTLAAVETIPADDPRVQLLNCLFWPNGATFLQAQGYLPAGQDLPAGPARPDHQDLLPQVEAPDEPAGWAWTATWRHMYTQHFACFGPDGQTFVGWNPGVEARGQGLWNFSGEQVRPFDWMGDWTVNDMAVSADGRFLAAPWFSSHLYEVPLVDLQAEPAVWGSLYHTHNVVKAVWSPAAPLVAAAATRSVWVWDAPAVIGPIVNRKAPDDPAGMVQPVHRFRGFRATVQGLSFSPDGKLLAAGAREGRMRIWEVTSGHEKADLDGKSGKLNHLAFSPDGNTVATACSKGLVVWDVD